MSEMRSDPEILAARLDRVLPPGTPFIPPRTKDPLVNTAIDIAATSFPNLSTAAMQRMEGKMLAAFDTRFPAKNGKVYANGHHRVEVPTLISKQAQPRRALGALRWAAAALFLLLFFGGSLTAASASAIPGDALYTVKRAVEQVEIAVAPDPQQRAEVLLRQAERRTEEALILSARRQSPAVVLGEAQSNLDRAFELNPALRESVTVAERVNQVEALIERVNTENPPPSNGETPVRGGGAERTDTPRPTSERTPNAQQQTRDAQEAGVDTPRTPDPSRTPRPTNVRGGANATRTAEAESETALTPDPSRTPRPTNQPQGQATPRGGQAQPTPNPGGGNNGNPPDNGGGNGGGNNNGNPPDNGGANGNAQNPPGGNPGGGDPPPNNGGGNNGGGNNGGGGGNNGGGNGGGNGNG